MKRLIAHKNSFPQFLLSYHKKILTARFLKNKAKSELNSCARIIILYIMKKLSVCTGSFLHKLYGGMNMAEKRGRVTIPTDLDVIRETLDIERVGRRCHP